MVTGKPEAHILSNIPCVLGVWNDGTTFSITERPPDKIFNPRCFCSICKNFTMSCLSYGAVFLKGSDMNGSEDFLKSLIFIRTIIGIWLCYLANFLYHCLRHWFG